MKTVDDIFEQIQGTGLYHKRLLYYLLSPIFFVTPFVFLNQIFVLHIPDHWCDPPPGLTPAELNLNLEEWKDLMLPKVLGPDYQMRWSQCHMYNVQNQTLESILRNKNLTGMPQISCEDVNGYQYDKSEMIATAVTDNDWVCSRQNYATNLYTIGVAGLIVGSGLLSALADFKGRKYSFFISTLLVIICSIVPIWFSHSYLWYCIFKALSFACMMPLFQSPMNITTEISTSKMRGYVIGIACIAWSLGNCALPLLAWLVNWWTTLRILCVAPLCFIFFYYEMLPESPRWLISKGRTDEALVIIKKIAKINEIKTDPDLKEKIEAIAKATNENVYGYLSLFSSTTMALRTLFVTMAFTASSFVYYQLVINIGNMAGNIFLNMFFLGLVEGPGCAIGVYAANKFGRRWTHFTMLFVNFVLFFILMWVVYYPNLNVLVIGLCMIIKLSISGTFVVAYVQAMEVFPTAIRQSGIGFCTLISQLISIGGPYVIYLGAYDLKLPYLIMSLICLMGAIAVSFLPETLGGQMPQTLADVKTFGQDHRYFSYLPHQISEEDKKENLLEVQTISPPAETTN